LFGNGSTRNNGRLDGDTIYRWSFNRSGRKSLPGRSLVASFRPVDSFSSFSRRPAAALHLEHFVFDSADNGFVLIVVLKEIGDIKEGVAIEADIDECRLHSRQNARYTAFVDASREGVFFFPFVEQFHDLIVFKDRHPCLVASCRNDKLFRHSFLPLGSLKSSDRRESGPENKCFNPA
jgi:hypothetical protein